MVRDSHAAVGAGRGDRLTPGNGRQVHSTPGHDRLYLRHRTAHRIHKMRVETLLRMRSPFTRASTHLGQLHWRSCLYLQSEVWRVKTNEFTGQ
jgi:hypothetical protein